MLLLLLLLAWDYLVEEQGQLSWLLNRLAEVLNLCRLLCLRLVYLKLSCCLLLRGNFEDLLWLRLTLWGVSDLIWLAIDKVCVLRVVKNKPLGYLIYHLVLIVLSGVKSWWLDYLPDSWLVRIILNEKVSVIVEIVANYVLKHLRLVLVRVF